MASRRRERLDLHHRSELAIRRAIIEVEVMPADSKLSKAIKLMQEAKDLVSDYIDNIQNENHGKVL